MGELRVEHVGLEGHVADPFSVGMQIDTAHQDEVAHYHYDNDADVVGEREHKAAEVILVLEISFVRELGDGLNALVHFCHILSERFFYFSADL